MTEKVKESGIIIKGLDLLDIIRFIKRTNKKYQAILLSQIEDLNLSKEIYNKIRKLLLDSFNNYTRAIVYTIFGDIDK